MKREEGWVGATVGFDKKSPSFIPGYVDEERLAIPVEAFQQTSLNSVQFLLFSFAALQGKTLNTD